MATVSVIVPVYNVEAYLCRCIDSILMQSYKDFELIIVNDGSSDNCPLICNNYKEKDDRVVVIHKENGGLSSARNSGLDYVFANSNSTYISFVDGDDYVAIDFLSKMVGKINDKDMIVCNYFRVTNDNIATDDSYNTIVLNNEKYLDFFRLHKPLCSVSWNKLYRREIFLNLRFPMGKICEDNYLIPKILCLAKQVIIIDDCLYYYVNRNESIINNASNSSLCYAWAEAFADNIYFLYHNNYSLCKAYFINFYNGYLENLFSLMRDKKSIRELLRRKVVFALKRSVGINVSKQELLMYYFPKFYTFLISHNLVKQ